MEPEDFARIRRDLSDNVIAALIEAFTGLGSWRDADASDFVATVIPLVRGGQRALASLIAAHTAQRATEALGRPVAAPAVGDDQAVNLRAGVDDTEVYLRPFKAVYLGLSRGDTLASAVAAGSKRLREIAEMDLQQTYAHASRAALAGLPAGARPQFWRRVLVGFESCGLCVVASTQRYRVEQLNPIHPGCDCAVEGIYGRDPGQVIEPELLDQVHDAVEQLTGQADAGARGPDYRQLVVSMTAEHGEIGDLLVHPRHRFTSAADLGER